MTYWKYWMLRVAKEKENVKRLKRVKPSKYRRNHEKSEDQVWSRFDDGNIGRLTCRLGLCSPEGYVQSMSRWASLSLWVPGAHNHRRGQCQRSREVWQQGNSTAPHPNTAYSTHSNLLVDMQRHGKQSILWTAERHSTPLKRTKY